MSKAPALVRTTDPKIVGEKTVITKEKAEIISLCHHPAVHGQLWQQGCVPEMATDANSSSNSSSPAGTAACFVEILQSVKKMRMPASLLLSDEALLSVDNCLKTLTEASKAEWKIKDDNPETIWKMAQRLKATLEALDHKEMFTLASICPNTLISFQKRVLEHYEAFSLTVCSTNEKCLVYHQSTTSTKGTRYSTVLKIPSIPANKLLQAHFLMYVH